jgi:uncharacterized membrane protein YcaP (DUF421 family)
VPEPVETQETNMTSQAEEEESEDDVSEDEEMILEDLDEEDMRERWEFAQTHKHKYAGVSPFYLQSLQLTSRKSEMLESSNQ